MIQTIIIPKTPEGPLRFVNPLLNSKYFLHHFTSYNYQYNYYYNV